MSGEECKTVILDNVTVQENGLIRNSKGNIIATLDNGVLFEDDCIQKEAISKPKFNIGDVVAIGCFGTKGIINKVLPALVEEEPFSYIVDLIEPFEADEYFYPSIISCFKQIIPESCLQHTTIDT